jgi:hypothetical protein
VTRQRRGGFLSPLWVLFPDFGSAELTSLHWINSIAIWDCSCKATHTGANSRADAANVTVRTSSATRHTGTTVPGPKLDARLQQHWILVRSVSVSSVRCHLSPEHGSRSISKGNFIQPWRSLCPEEHSFFISIFVSQLTKKCRVFYGTWRLITVIQSTPSHPLLRSFWIICIIFPMRATCQANLILLELIFFVKICSGHWG